METHTFLVTQRQAPVVWTRLQCEQCRVDTITFTYCSLHTLEIMPNSAHVSGLHCLFVCGRQTLVNVCCMSIVDYAYTFAPPLGLQYMHYWCCCTRLHCCCYPPPIDSLSCSIIVEYSLQLGRYVYAWPITAAQHTLKNHSLHIQCFCGCSICWWFQI